jgi:hypothetical protein
MTVITSKNIKWMKSMHGKINAHKILVRKPEGKIILGRIIFTFNL